MRTPSLRPSGRILSIAVYSQTANAVKSQPVILSNISGQTGNFGANGTLPGPITGPVGKGSSWSCRDRRAGGAPPRVRLPVIRAHATQPPPRRAGAATGIFVGRDRPPGWA